MDSPLKIPFVFVPFRILPENGNFVVNFMQLYRIANFIVKTSRFTNYKRANIEVYVQSLKKVCISSLAKISQEYGQT